MLFFLSKSFRLNPISLLWLTLAGNLALLGMLMPPYRLGATDTENAASVEATRKYPKRVYTITRIAGLGPAIDGVLDEACWQSAPWHGGFVQRSPHEGGSPSEQTEIKLLYDDEAIYVAIKAYVPDVANRDQQVSRRDASAGDMVGIAFDSFLDRRTAFQFSVTGGGTKVDQFRSPDGNDSSWNAVWDVAVGETQDAWISEFRIPFSQLRYPKNVADRTWGMHAWRWHRASSMESNWQLIPRDHSGVVYEFGELRGLERIEPKRQIEVLPYTSGKLLARPLEAGNPFRDGTDQEFEAGLDAKISITSNFILDLTLNPDFGQVESDPADLNLGTVETFFREQRPFFLEGKSLFDFNVNGDQLFYSRRIGRRPSYIPDVDGHVEVPTGTRILGAAKLTGKTRSGLSLAGLAAFADREEALIFENDAYRRETAEPQAQYFVVSISQELREGGTTIGGMVTGTKRQLEHEDATLLPRSALTAGFDFTHRWWDRTHYAFSSIMGSRVSGSTTAIAELQQNNLHNFQRPDAKHLRFDPTREALQGWGGRAGVGKDNGGQWRYQSELEWQSPALNINDIGYIDSVNRIRQQNTVRYVQTTPGESFKSFEYRFAQNNFYLYDGTHVKQNFQFHGSYHLRNNWNVGHSTTLDTDSYDTGILRGGPAMKRPGYWTASARMSSDGSKDFMWWASAYADRALEGGSGYLGFWPGFQLRRGGQFLFNFNLGFSEADYHLQWVGDAAQGPDGDVVYVLGRIKRDTIQSTLRLEYNFTPDMSLAFFGNLYLTSGRYEHFKLITDPMASRLQDRFSQFDDGGWVRRADEQLEFMHEAGNFRVDDPDFNYRTFRSNLVFRWEYKPGSTLFVVWSHDRADSELERSESGESELSRLVNAPANNTIMVKASYWFSI